MPIYSFSASSVLDGTHLAAAVKAVREQGIVVIEDAVDLGHIAKIRDKWIADVPRLLSRPDKPFNWNPNNLQQEPPPTPEYLFRDVLVNDAVIRVTKEILGNGLKNAFYSGNTALQGPNRQPVHADMGQLWPGQEVAHPAYALVVNLPLVDMGPENGATEIWPGTHLDVSVVQQDGDIKASAEAQAKWRKVEEPVQPFVKAGSAIIRDIRMWHAGMPNHTPVPRPMLAMIHYVYWWQTEPLKFPKGTEALFEHPDLFTHAEFVEGEIDYIGNPGGFEYAEAK